jgi:hypothetical protein
MAANATESRYSITAMTFAWPSGAVLVIHCAAHDVLGGALGLVKRPDVALGELVVALAGDDGRVGVDNKDRAVRVARRELEVDQRVGAADDETGGQCRRGLLLPDGGGVFTGELENRERRKHGRRAFLFRAALGEKEHIGDLAGLPPLGEQLGQTGRSRRPGGHADQHIGRGRVSGDGQHRGTDCGQKPEGAEARKEGGGDHGVVVVAGKCGAIIRPWPAWPARPAPRRRAAAGICRPP